MVFLNTILVVDDDPALCHTLALVLNREGYAVTTALHPYQALQSLRVEAYNLVFLDIKLPDIDGLTLLSQIRRLRPDTAVLILTAHATPQLKAEALQLGARVCLSKPANPVDILAHVRAILVEP
ncbi:MAG: response regulator [Anaerolineae bacterium]